MKKIIFLLFIYFFLCGFVFISGRPPSGAIPTPDFSEDFNTSDTGSVADNTDFQTEDDDSNKLDIYSNELRYYADTPGNKGDVQETATFNNDVEVTCFFSWEAEDILAIDGGGSTSKFIQFENDSGSAVCAGRLIASSGNLWGYRIQRLDSSEDGNNVQMTGIAADTKYYCYVYALVDSSGTTAMRCDTDINISDSSWAESNTGTDDNSGVTGIGEIMFGGTYNGFGDGTTDTYFYLDNIKCYNEDQRSCTNCAE